MLSGRIELTSLTRPLNADLQLAQPEYLESCSFSQPDFNALLVVERDANQSLAMALAPLKGQAKAIREWAAQYGLQSLLIERPSLQRPTLRMTRNMQATCPLYALLKKGVLHLRWDPTALYDYLEGPNILDRDQCLGFLDGQWAYDSATIFRDIVLLPERAVLEVEPGTLNIIRPPALAVPQPQPLAVGANPVEILHAGLEQVIRRWPLVAHRTACELSSGLDTTLVALVTAGLLPPHTLKTLGYFSEDTAPAIWQRRNETLHKIQARDYCTPHSRSFDFSSLARGERFWPYLTGLNHQADVSIRQLAADGVRLVFSGVGGDELSALSQQEHSAGGATHSFGRVVTEAGFASLLPNSVVAPDDMPAWPQGLVAASVQEMANLTAPAYLQNGIWYAHPLGQSELQVFAHFLPVDWRRDRHISRAVLSHLGMSDFFIRQDPRETSLPDMNRVLAEEAMLDALFRDSILVSEGLLDLAKLKHNQKVIRKNPNIHDTAFTILTACSLELALQSLQHAREFA